MSRLRGTPFGSAQGTICKLRGTPFGSAITFRMIVLPMTLVPSILASLLAAVLPVRMAVGIVPAQVLKED